MEKHSKKFFKLGCCGIDCGLCPRYYTEGKSRCPGCFGENFPLKHPPCSFASCCVKKNNLDACGQCKDFPCKKYEGDKVLKDSFVTHQKMMGNQEYIKANGIEKYIKEQSIRIKIPGNDLKNKSRALKSIIEKCAEEMKII